MARARNIKHSFFTNDDLADCPPLARLLFIGLWTLADCQGRLQDKPRQIKVQILPYDECDIEQLLNNLDLSGFIQRYTEQGQPVIQVVNFTKHQTPHKNEREKGSELPEYTGKKNITQVNHEVKKESRLIQINPDKDGTDREERGKRKEERGKRKEERGGSSELESSAPEFITLTLNDKTEFPVHDNEILEWGELYPAVDVKQCLRNMRGWCISNHTKRKTKTGIRKFINAWLAREQNSGGTPKKNINSSASEIPDFARDNYKRDDDDCIDGEQVA